MTAPRLAFVGTGAVASALALAWRAAGGVVTGVLSRDATRAARWAARVGGASGTDPSVLAGAEVVLVCVPDRAVSEVGRSIGAWCGAARDGGPLLLHTSGALAGGELLAQCPAAQGRVRVGSLHPLQSFPASVDAALADRVSGVHWFHEGDGADAARTLVAHWVGTFHALAPGSKALYHAGAAVLSNHAVALFADATRLFAAAGVAPEASRPALAQLLLGTASNLAAVGVPAALTGPVARGDVSTVLRHLVAIEASAPEMLEAYRAMARRAVVVALAKGTIDAAGAAELTRVLAEPLRGA